MIYLFHGSDIEKVRSKAFEWVAKARAKEPNLSYVRLAREELSVAALEDAIASGGLFVSRLLILIDDPLPAGRQGSSVGEEEDEEAESVSANVLEDALDALAASDNAFVILAPKLFASKAKKLAAKAKMTYVWDKAVVRETARGFNSGLASALGARASEKLWLEVVRALQAGDAPEMLHGLLHWKARDILEKGSAKWEPFEARHLSLDLIALLMDSRRKGLDLSRSLERFALAI